MHKSLLVNSNVQRRGNLYQSGLLQSKTHYTKNRNDLTVLYYATETNSTVCVSGTIIQNMNGYLLLTPHSKVLLEKLTGYQLVKKFPTFHGTKRYSNAFTCACHLSLSWATL